MPFGFEQIHSFVASELLSKKKLGGIDFLEGAICQEGSRKQLPDIRYQLPELSCQLS
ncbi:MAG: hypothetical protein ACJAZC_002960 [Cryomorphaceae bacterium]|jgi:hypothetical protein